MSLLRTSLSYPNIFVDVVSLYHAVVGLLATVCMRVGVFWLNQGGSDQYMNISWFLFNAGKVTHTEKNISPGV